MTLYVNSDVHTRVWLSLANKDGTTLRLEPGATADLDPADVGDDPFLVAAPAAASAPDAPSPADAPPKATRSRDQAAPVPPSSTTKEK